MDFDPLHGDSEFDWIVSDWRSIDGGVKFPFRQQYEVGGRKLMEFEVEEVAVNPALECIALQRSGIRPFQCAEDGDVQYPLSMDICAAS